ncbi:MAG: HD domain-containing protein [Candidatus Krumholzibacteria bacterium]|nr:HD domain-containing protein [Candidatus Krumholzibacteria bacterium]
MISTNDDPGRFSDLIILLSGGINQRKLYFDSHPKIKKQGASFASQLRERLNNSGETAFFFGILNGKFIRDGTYLIGPSIAGKNLIEFAEKMNCGGFLFRKNIEAEEVSAFFRVAAELRDPVENIEAAQTLFASEGLRNIDLSSFYREAQSGQEPQNQDISMIDPGLIQFDFSEHDDADGGMGKTISDELAPLLPIFQSMYEAVTDNNLKISRDKDLDMAQTFSVGEDLHDVSDRETMDIMNLMRYPDYDSYTIGHSVRVSTLALTVGREMGWPEEGLAELATAGLLHDIGKAKVPEEILYKPGRLDAAERTIAESHAAIGANILLSRGEASPLVIAGAWGHHIRHDGGGYPPLPDWAILSPIAGLIQVCDVFEALTAARPYKLPMPPRRAFEIILKDRAAFCPLALAALIRSIGLYPPGSEVVLSDGTRGYVMRKGPDWEQPEVRLTQLKNGTKLDKEDQIIKQLHLEEDLEVADFLMVGLDAEDGNPTADELIEETSREIDAIMEDATT